MIRRLPPIGLRGKLALAIAVITVVALGVTFAAVYSGTGSRLRGQIDLALRTQLDEWRVFTARAPLSTPAQLTRTAHSFIHSQRYHAEALVIVVQVAGGPLVTNQGELLAREGARPGNRGLLAAPTGFSDRWVAEAGMMRVLTVPVGRVGTLRFAASLRPVSAAQSSLRQTFALVAGVVLAAAILAGLLVAALIAAPLRRITAVAEGAAAGDLSLRAGPVRGRDEVAILARGFDEMLSRLQRAFTRQQQFVSDASHELRTPLAVARAQTRCSTGSPIRRSGTNRLRCCCAGWMSWTG